MNTMKRLLALMLALTLLLTFTACGKDKGGDTDTTTDPTTTVGGSDSTTTDADATTTTTEGLLPEEERDGSKDKPFEIGGVLEFDAAVKAGAAVYYNVYRVGGTILTLKSQSAAVEYDGKTYEPKNGVISFPVTTDDILNPIQLVIHNKGAADATFKVTFAYPAGTKNNPIALKEGDLVTELKKGDEDGLIYLYTATASGTLTIVDNAVVTKGVSFDISLFNLNTSASRTLVEDGVEKGGKRMVSVEVNKGDKVEVTIATLLNDKNEYPAATIKSQVAFAAGEVTVKPIDITYSVTVKDNKGAFLSGVKLEFTIGSNKVTATTDKNGVATVTQPAADGRVAVTIPEGYNGNLIHAISVTNPSITILLTKEEAEAPVEPDLPESTTLDYTVTVLDSSAKPVAGVAVSILSGGNEVAKQTTNAKGVVTATLDRGSYTVALSGHTGKYDEKAAVLSASKPNLTLALGGELNTAKKFKIYPPENDKGINAYYLSEGATYVPLTAGSRNYFLFEPTRAGTFRFSSSNPSARIGHYGSDMGVYDFNMAEVSGNAFTLSVAEDMLGGTVYVIGLDATCAAAVVQITRIGDPAWNIADVPAEEYKGNGNPKPVTAPSDLVDVDIKSATAYDLVYSEKDGYYHLNSATGPVVYVRMNDPKLNFMEMFKKDSQTGRKDMQAVLYNADGTFLRKEQYAPLMEKYHDMRDKTQNVYPLTEDLKYMIDHYGNSQNLWNVGEPGYLFEEEEGVNPANAWLFLYCYKK